MLCQHQHAFDCTAIGNMTSCYINDIYIYIYKTNNLVRIRLVYQRYCEAMKNLSLAIMEILAISLGVDRYYYRDFFHESSSIMRCNYYPPCQEPELTLGTGPHCDPTSLTILQQDQVGGLEVLADGEWRSVRPIRDALVINIGDTFMVRVWKSIYTNQITKGDIYIYICMVINCLIEQGGHETKTSPLVVS